MKNLLKDTKPLKTNEYKVYIVQCSDLKQSLYTGITNDLLARLKKHNNGTGARFTKGRGPITLLVTFDCESRSAALKLECKIKKLSRKKKLELISDVYDQAISDKFG